MPNCFRRQNLHLVGVGLRRDEEPLPHYIVTRLGSSVEIRRIRSIRRRRQVLSILMTYLHPPHSASPGSGDSHVLIHPSATIRAASTEHKRARLAGSSCRAICLLGTVLEAACRRLARRLLRCPSSLTKPHRCPAGRAQTPLQLHVYPLSARILHGERMPKDWAQVRALSKSTRPPAGGHGYMNDSPSRRPLLGFQRYPNIADGRGRRRKALAPFHLLLTTNVQDLVVSLVR